MKLNDYIQKQRKLDAYVESHHPRKPGETRIREKTLALIIEMAEMINELPESFKFWSTKKNNMEKALEEFVDVFHFLLSLGAEMDMEALLDHVEPYDTERSVLEQQLHLIGTAAELIGSPLGGYYIHTFEEFLTYGRLLGFTNEMIENAYNKKNAVNFERQDNNY